MAPRFPALAVRVDPEQNVWIVDEGSNTVQKVDPTGLVKMVAWLEARIH